jgi:RNA polymerase sigma-70 factor (ECF subfamily)
MRASPTTDEVDERDRRLVEEGRFAEVLAHHRDDLRTVIARRMWAEGRDDIDDVLQSALLRLFRELSAGKRYPVPVRVAAFKIAQWEVGAWLRARGLAVARDGGDPAGHDGLAADDHVGYVMTRLTVAAVLDALPGREREVGTLRFIRGREPTEIATELGLTRGAVDTALSRARAHLRKAFES